MTTHPNYSKYYNDRIACIRQAIRINEEFLSSADDWESYESFLDKRDNVIDRLKALDDAYGQGAILQCTKEQRDEMDDALNLVLALDKDITEAINKERMETLASMKATSVNKKIAGYGFANHTAQGGRLLDRKE